MSCRAPRPKFYFSLQSPYSWFASVLLQRHFPDVLAGVEMIPMFRPDEQARQAMRERGVELLYAEMTKAKHMYILQDTKRLAAQLDLPIVWPIDRDPWWVLPHHAWLAAKRTGDADRLYWALVAARWERGENICDPHTVQRIAHGIGLDGAAVAAAADDPAIREEGMACIEAAYLDDIFGMPYFKVGPHRFWGVDRISDFVAAFRRQQEKVATK
ncbi:DsbA family protein [Nocardia sp. NPDC051052]|uniref:DsbA family protein n=1 Tax=Nocardia sp. NPDC051052 TaxID=3364322 RepID=UPI00378941B9